MFYSKKRKVKHLKSDSIEMQYFVNYQVGGLSTFMLINCFFDIQQKCTCAYTNLLHAIEIVGQLGVGILIEKWVKTR